VIRLHPLPSQCSIRVPTSGSMPLKPTAQASLGETAATLFSWPLEAEHGDGNLALEADLGDGESAGLQGGRARTACRYRGGE
jgi:hypothetical protein